MFHLNDAMLQDSELDLVVGGFLGGVIQTTKMHALHLDKDTKAAALGRYDSVDAGGTYGHRSY